MHFCLAQLVAGGIRNYVACFCLFVWFDSLRPINNLSVIKGLVYLGWTSTKLGLLFLLEDTTQWCWWPFSLESSTLPLSHCAPMWPAIVFLNLNAVQPHTCVEITLSLSNVDLTIIASSNFCCLLITGPGSGPTGSWSKPFDNLIVFLECFWKS